MPKRLEVEKFTVRDDASDATFSGSLDSGHFKAAYNGTLAGRSIERTFAKPPLALGQLQGDFQADGNLKRPDATTASGYLQGTKITLPPILPVPVTIDNLSLQAKNTVLVVKSATVSSGESSVDVSGTVAYLKDKFAVDADIKGKKVVIPEEPAHSDAAAKPDSQATAQADAAPAPEPESEESSVSKTEAGEETAPPSESIFHNEARQRALLAPLWTIPVAGVVRVDLGLLDTGGFEIAPLVGSAALQTGRLELSLKRAALCGITLSGEVTAMPDSADAELKLSSHGIQLDKSIACLTDQRLQITGKLDLDGQFSARGRLGTLSDQLRGTFTATAKDGHINKFDSLAAVLKVVNVTQAFFGQMPDLSKGGMDYSSARVQGRVEGSKIFFHSVELDASALTVAAHGNIDYATKAMDITVLVAPFKTVSWIVAHTPILRSIFGSTFIAVPVQVRGTVDKPVVVPLGPSAVGSQAFGILINTLKLPADAINLVAPPPAGTSAGTTAGGAAPSPASSPATNAGKQ